jgi:hypothetical protein
MNCLNVKLISWLYPCVNFIGIRAKNITVNHITVNIKRGRKALNFVGQLIN